MTKGCCRRLKTALAWTLVRNWRRFAVYHGGANSEPTDLDIWGCRFDETKRSKNTHCSQDCIPYHRLTPKRLPLALECGNDSEFKKPRLGGLTLGDAWIV